MKYWPAGAIRRAGEVDAEINLGYEALQPSRASIGRLRSAVHQQFGVGQMSSLTAIEKRVLERLLEMSSGYVLNFSDRTFQEFVLDAVGVDIYEEQYDYASGSKANRMRGFWFQAPDHLVAKLLGQMVELLELEFDPDSDLLERAKAIVARLEGATSVDELDALQPNADDPAFEVLAGQVHEAITNGEPEVGLDRLHTFVSKYVHVLATHFELTVTRDDPLNSVFGKVVRELSVRGLLESRMTEMILKSTISIFESFNAVRNNQSLAHPNELISYDEALLIYRNVASVIRFLESIMSTGGLEGAGA